MTDSPPEKRTGVRTMSTSGALVLDHLGAKPVGVVQTTDAGYEPGQQLDAQVGR
jgi:hypothetical protein